jgi:hypothetical protein
MHSLLHCAPTIIACCTTHSSIDSRCVGCTECLEVPWLAMLRLNWEGVTGLRGVLPVAMLRV